MKYRITFISLFIAIIMASVSCSSGSASDELSQIIEANRKSLPMSIDETTAWKDIVIADGYVVYTYVVTDPTGTVVSSISDKHEDLIAQINESLNQKDFYQFIQLVEQNGLSLKYTYTDSQIGTKGEIVVTNEELKGILASHLK